MLKKDYKAWEDCPEVEECELIQSFLELVDTLIRDVKHLEAEVIRTRYERSRYLELGYADGLRSDILSNLAGRCYDNLAYQEYIRVFYDGGDPMEFKDYLDSIHNLTKGIDDEKY